MSQPPPADPLRTVEPAPSTIQPRVCGLAIASLAFAFLPVPLVGSILAIVFSVKARRRIERSQGALTGKGLADTGLIIACFTGMAWLALLVPPFFQATKKGARSQAVANAKSIGRAMLNFEQDYGSFPSSGEGGTATQVLENNTESGYTFGSHYSNDYFRQLVASGHMDSERVFYAEATYTRKPDNNLTGNKRLAAGEVGFAYVMASKNEAIPSTGNSGRPLILAAVYNGATDGTCDPEVYTGRAVVLRIDQSATDLPVRPSDRKVLVGRGKTLLECGSEDTVWGTEIHPILKAPKMIKGN